MPQPTVNIRRQARPFAVAALAGFASLAWAASARAAAADTANPNRGAAPAVEAQAGKAADTMGAKSREAGQATAHAGREAGHAVAKESREAGHAAAKESREAGHAVAKESRKLRPQADTSALEGEVVDLAAYAAHDTARTAAGGPLGIKERGGDRIWLVVESGQGPAQAALAPHLGHTVTLEGRREERDNLKIFVVTRLAAAPAGPEKGRQAEAGKAGAGKAGSSARGAAGGAGNRQ